MKPFSSFIDDARGQVFKLGKAAQVVNEAQRVLNERYTGISQYVRVLSCVDGVVRIACTSSAVLSDITMHEQLICEHINAAQALVKVERIVCLVNDPSMR